jgi:2-dehydropantoate 2-reductase
MRIVIFGTGAMACLFGARLSSVSEVTLMGTWADGIAAMRKRGILFDDFRESRSAAVWADHLGTPQAPADFALILVKSWQTDRIASYIEDYLTPDGIAISLQNGLGNLEWLGARVLSGTTAEGATLLGPGHVRAGGTGPTYVGAPDWAVELLKSAGFDCQRCSPSGVEGALWGKLLVSCGINALTALLRIPNGELLKNPEVLSLMVRASQECASVAQARGIQLPFSDPAERVKEVAAQTATNRSSMLQDILRGAPTECDAINGAVVREGKRLNVPTPVNEWLWRQIKAAVLENRNEVRSCGSQKALGN